MGPLGLVGVLAEELLELLGELVAARQIRSNPKVGASLSGPPRPWSIISSSWVTIVWCCGFSATSSSRRMRVALASVGS